MTEEQILVADGRHALRWAADGEFSARITPAMARALLHEEANLLATIAMQKAVIEQLKNPPVACTPPLRADHRDSPYLGRH